MKRAARQRKTWREEKPHGRADWPAGQQRRRRCFPELPCVKAGSLGCGRCPEVTVASSTKGNFPTAYSYVVRATPQTLVEAGVLERRVRQGKHQLVFRTGEDTRGLGLHQILPLLPEPPSLVWSALLLRAPLPFS